MSVFIIKIFRIDMKKDEINDLHSDMKIEDSRNLVVIIIEVQRRVTFSINIQSIREL
jgi:hypothetical protein